MGIPGRVLGDEMERGEGVGRFALLLAFESL